MKTRKQNVNIYYNKPRPFKLYAFFDIPLQYIDAQISNISVYRTTKIGLKKIRVNIIIGIV